MRFNTKDSIKLESILYGIPILLVTLWRIIQFQIFGIPLPEWVEYAFLAYLAIGIVYFGFLHKANKM